MVESTETVGEMAQLEKCFPHKYEGLSSIPPELACEAGSGSAVSCVIPTLGSHPSDRSELQVQRETPRDSGLCTHVHAQRQLEESLQCICIGRRPHSLRCFSSSTPPPQLSFSPTTPSPTAPAGQPLILLSSDPASTLNWLCRATLLRPKNGHSHL